MAVYTHVGQSALRAFLKDYDLGKVLSFKGIAEGVENSNYLLRAEGGDFILTLYEDRMSEKDLPFALGLMNHLARKGFCCATVKPNRNDALYGILENRPTTVISFMEGVSFGDPSPDHCEAVGRALARMHLLAADYQETRRDPMAHEDWLSLFASCRGEAAEASRPEIESDLAEILSDWPSSLPGGAVHGDLFPDNVLFREMTPSFIDFSFACANFWAADLAICMNAWGFDGKGALRPSHMKSLIEGYHWERALSSDERAALTPLARAAAMQFFLMRLRARQEKSARREALVRLKDPMEYLARLRFHRHARSLADYGLSNKPRRAPKNNKAEKAEKAEKEASMDIYTDGSCEGNPGRGGWGVVILRDGQLVREMSGGERQTTNNRMELLAVIYALEELPLGEAARIHTDSQYAQKGATEYLQRWKENGWKSAAKKPVKNEDLWRRLDALLAERRVSWRWLRGHDGDRWNERADEIARGAIASQSR